jgi:hypothetical protein
MLLVVNKRNNYISVLDTDDNVVETYTEEDLTKIVKGSSIHISGFSLTNKKNNFVFKNIKFSKFTKKTMQLDICADANYSYSFCVNNIICYGVKEFSSYGSGKHSVRYFQDDLQYKLNATNLSMLILYYIFEGKQSSLLEMFYDLYKVKTVNNYTYNFIPPAAQKYTLMINYFIYNNFIFFYDQDIVIKINLNSFSDIEQIVALKARYKMLGAEVDIDSNGVIAIYSVKNFKMKSGSKYRINMNCNIENLIIEDGAEIITSGNKIFYFGKVTCYDKVILKRLLKSLINNIDKLIIPESLFNVYIKGTNDDFVSLGCLYKVSVIPDGSSYCRKFINKYLSEKALLSESRFNNLFDFARNFGLDTSVLDTFTHKIKLDTIQDIFKSVHADLCSKLESYLGVGLDLDDFLENIDFVRINPDCFKNIKLLCSYINNEDYCYCSDDTYNKIIENIRRFNNENRVYYGINSLCKLCKQYNLTIELLTGKDVVDFGFIINTSNIKYGSISLRHFLTDNVTGTGTSAIVTSSKKVDLLTGLLKAIDIYSGRKKSKIYEDLNIEFEFFYFYNSEELFDLWRENVK